MSRSLRLKWNALQDQLRKHGRVLVAFSGGTDSVLVAEAARRTLGHNNVLAVTAVSPSLALIERTKAADMAAALYIEHRFIETEELSNPSYRANPTNRCFFCKSELYARLNPIALEEKRIVVDGFNASDRSDFRPGVQAAEKWKVHHPLHEADLFKKEIRSLSRWLKLSTWNKPASPCLSSRIPYGTPVDEVALRRIDRAEAVLHQEGFLIARVRHYGAHARIEVPITDIDKLLDETRQQRIKNAFEVIGYQSLEIDPRGFRSGSLNGTRGKIR